jgi:PleD family two-component response regulator
MAQFPPHRPPLRERRETVERKHMIPVPDVNDRPARILIVDDEVRNRTLLQVMLSAEGYQFTMASSARRHSRSWRSSAPISSCSIS